MLLIGGYTHYPVGIPAKAGEGVALFREENNTVEKIIPAENPSFLASDSSGGFFALKESDSGFCSILFRTVLKAHFRLRRK